MNEENREQVILAGADTGQLKDFSYSMEELKRLAEALDMDVQGIFTQRLDQPDRAHYIGMGKIEEIREFSRNWNSDLIIFNDSLSPSQLRNLQSMLEKPVMDRTSLILDIFMSRARTREAKLQVEAARLKYTLSRLTGMHEALTRQGGTSGSMSSRGIGEKKLELDRRRIEHRLAELGKELKLVGKERETQRKKRMQTRIPRVSLVGYTNAGKSTVLNRMVEQYLHEDSKKVLEKDMLFATLDTSVRHISVGNSQSFLLSDTVGFIDQLPPALVEAFHSTLEEILTADLILHVADYSDPHYKQQLMITRQTLSELGAGNIPVLLVNNKTDLVQGGEPDYFQQDFDNMIYISAQNPSDIARLVKKITELIYRDYEAAEFSVPYTEGAVLSILMEEGIMTACEYRENGVTVTGRFHRADTGKFSKYRICK